MVTEDSADDAIAVDGFDHGMQSGVAPETRK
jgi:hypothetical protein